MDRFDALTKGAYRFHELQNQKTFRQSTSESSSCHHIVARSAFYVRAHTPNQTQKSVRSVCLFARLCVHSFIHSFMHACMHACMQSFIHAFIHSCIHSFILSFVHSVIHSLTHSFMHSCIRSFIHSFVHSLIN